MKSSKICFCSSSSMPMPVSVTSIFNSGVSLSWSRTSASIVMRPSFVNFTEFPMTFIKICWMRSRSAQIQSAEGPFQPHSNVVLLAAAAPLWLSTISCNSVLRFIATGRNRSLPASYFVISSTSEMWLIKSFPDVSIFLMDRICFALKRVSRNKARFPRRPFRGVRISWLMVARKSVLAFSPANARSRAATSSASASTR